MNGRRNGISGGDHCHRVIIVGIADLPKWTCTCDWRCRSISVTSRINQPKILPFLVLIVAEGSQEFPRGGMLRLDVISSIIGIAVRDVVLEFRAGQVAKRPRNRPIRKLAA